jgi:hypothetical protein
MSITLTLKDMDIEFEIDSFYGGCPARLNCLPEDSYPEEGPEIEWSLCEDQDNVEFIQSALDNNDELSELVSELLIEHSNNQEPDGPD